MRGVMQSSMHSAFDRSTGEHARNTPRGNGYERTADTLSSWTSELGMPVGEVPGGQVPLAGAVIGHKVELPELLPDESALVRRPGGSGIIDTISGQSDVAGPIRAHNV